MRTLRTYRCVAHREHFCDNCHEYIQPGECYMGTVHLVGADKKKGHIVVLKEHCDPSCEMYTGPEGDDFLEEDQEEAGRRSEKVPEYPQNKAA